MRLPYVPNPPEPSSAANRAIVDRIQKRRGSRGLIPLDLALLHSVPVADGWNSFLYAIRDGTTISDSIRELAICRVGVLNKAWFEWDFHAPLLRACPGFTEEVMEYILHAPPAKDEGDGGAYDGPLDAEHAAVLAYTDAMTLSIKVPDNVFEQLRSSFGEREVVEITATIAAYNCVSRFLVALDVGEKNK